MALSIGSVLGAMLSAATLPFGLAAISSSGWAFVFAGIVYGIWRIAAGIAAARARRRGGHTEVNVKEIVAESKDTELVERVRASLAALQQESAAYGGQGARSLPSADPRRRATGSWPEGSAPGVEAQKLVEQIHAELLSEFQFYLSGEAGQSDLEAARIKAVSDRKNVRKKFGLPPTEAVKQLQREVGALPDVNEGIVPSPDR